MDKIEHEEIFAALAMPFDPDAIKHRSQGGQLLSYITTRAVMNRFDEVLGPSNWWPEYIDTKNGVKCKITLRFPDGSTTPKEATARNPEVPPRSAMAAERIANMPDDPKDRYAREKAERSEEYRRAEAIQLDDESTQAEAFKRAGVMWGVGRYLYFDGVPDFARHLFRGDQEHLGYPKPEKQKGETIPTDAGRNPTPVRSGTPPARSGAPPARSTPPPGNGQYGPPRTGKALFAWCKNGHGDERLNLVNQIGKELKYNDKMILWTQEQVEYVYSQASGDNQGESPDWPRRSH